MKWQKIANSIHWYFGGFFSLSEISFKGFAQQYYSTLMYSSDEEDETDKEDINE